MTVENRNDQDSYQKYIKGTAGLGLVGLGIAVYKMGGPHGRLLSRIKEKSIFDHFKPLGGAWAQETHRLERTPDLQGRTGKNRMATSTPLPNLEEIAQLENQFYDAGVIDKGLINDSKREELALANILDGRITNSKTSDLQPLKLIRGIAISSFSPGETDGVIGARIIVAKERLKLLKDHINTQGRHIPGAPITDLYSLEMSENPYAKSSEIDKIHQFFMENDVQYARKYQNVIKGIVRTISMSKNDQIASIPSRSMETTFDGNYVQDEALKIPKISSSVSQQLKELGVTIKPNVTSRLYMASEHPMMSDQIPYHIDKTLNAKGFKERLGYYSKDIKNIVMVLDAIKRKHPGIISDVYVSEERNKVSETAHRSYFTFGLVKNEPGKQPYNVEFHVPITENGISPNLTGFMKRPFKESGYFTMPSPLRVKEGYMINSTKMHLGKLLNIVNSAKMHDLLDRPANEVESEINQQLIDIQRQGNPYSYELRDAFAQHSMRFMHYDAIFNATTAPRRSVEMLRHGLRGLKIFKDLKRNPKNYVLLGLDLETLNPFDSPQYAATSSRTGLWQYGLTWMDSSGNIQKVEQVASDHVLNEVYPFSDEWLNDGKLARALEGIDEESKKLKAFAKYARRTIEGGGHLTDYEALIRYRDMIKDQAGTSRSHIISKYGRPVKNSEEFAQLLKSRIIEAKEEALKSGKKLYIVTKNGAFFDIELLKNLWGDQTTKLLADNIDIDAVSRAMTIGRYDPPANNISAHLTNLLQRKGKITNSTIIDFEKDIWGAINHLSSGGLVTVGRNKNESLKSYLKGQLGKYAQAHNSAVMDSVGTLGALQLMREFYSDTTFFDLKEIDAYIQKMSHPSMDTSLDMMMQLEGFPVPGQGGASLSFSFVPTNQSKKFIGSFIQPAHMNPWFSLDPLNKDLHQIYRNNWIKMRDSTDPAERQRRKWLTKNVFASAGDVEIREMMAKGSDWDINRYAHQLQLNTIFTLGRSGGTEGFLAMDSTLFTKYVVHSPELLALDDLPQDSKLAAELGRMYKEIETRAKELANKVGINPNVQGGEITMDIWEAAVGEIVGSKEKAGTLPYVKPGLELVDYSGDDPVKFSKRLGGRVVGIKMNKSPGTKSGISFLAQILYEGSDEDLSDAAFNVRGRKVLTKQIDAKSASMAYGKEGVLGDVHAIMNYDFLDKKYRGAMLETMLKNAVWVASFRADPANGFNHQEQVEAKEAIKKIVAKWGERLSINEHPDGTLTFGRFDITEDPKEIAKRMANISPKEILDTYSIVGHELVWNKQKLEAYYGFWDKDVWKARTHIKKQLASMLLSQYTNENSPLTRLEKEYNQTNMAMHQQELMDYVDPMTIIENDLRKKGMLKGGSIENHWKFIGDKEREDLINNSRAPIFTNIYHNPYDITDMQLGVIGYGVATTHYNTDTGKHPHNVKVKYLKSYNDLWMNEGVGLSESTKKIIDGSKGYQKYPKLLEVVKKYKSMTDTLRNSLLSDTITKHGLTINEVNAIVDRSSTVRHIDESLQRMRSRGETQQTKVYKETIDKLDEHAVEVGEVLKDDILGEMKTLSKMTDIERLENIRDKNHWYHAQHLHDKVASLARQKDNVLYLPAQIKEFDKDGRMVSRGETEITFEVDKIINDYNVAYMHENKLDPEVIKSFMRTIKKKYEAAGIDKSKRLMDYEMINGSMHISMGGFLLPVDRSMENIGYGIPSMLEDYKNLSDGSRHMVQMLGSYQAYAAELRRESGDKTYRVKKAGENLAFHQIKSLYWGLGAHKNSPVFKANSSETDGFQIAYSTADSIQSNARALKKRISAGDRGLLASIKEEGSSISHYGEVLDKIIDMKFNTVLVSTKTLLNNKTRFNFIDGNIISSATFGEMYDRMTDDARKFIGNVKEGKELLPGGTMLRFPVTQAGVLGPQEVNFHCVPGNILKRLGGNDYAAYSQMVRGQIIKADVDVDLQQVILKGFSTIEGVKALKNETSEAFSIYMNSEMTRDWIRKGNEQNLADYTVEEGGKRYAMLKRHNEITGDTFLEKVSNNAYNSLAPLGALYDPEMVIAANLGRNVKALERHQATSALNAYSKNTIGLWTNLMRDRVHQLFQGNAYLMKSPTTMMGLIGDLRHGWVGISQESISVGKHLGDPKLAYEMNEHYRTLNDPLRAAPEAVARARKWWIKSTLGTKESLEKAETAGQIFDTIFIHARGMDLLEKYDPAASHRLKLEKDNLIGRQGTNILTTTEYEMHYDKTIDEPLAKMALEGLTYLQGEGLANNPFTNPLYDKDKPFRILDNYADFLFEETRDPLDVAFGEKINRLIRPESVLRNKKVGKAAGALAMAYLGFQYFHPMKNNISSENNIFNSDVQLPENIPLDSINASFSKRAYVEMNDMEIDNKKGKSDYIAGVIRSNIEGANQTIPFKTKPIVTYNTYTNSMGIFGNGDYQRRMGLL